MRNAKNTKCRLPPALPGRHGQRRPPVPASVAGWGVSPSSPSPQSSSLKRKENPWGRGFGERRLGLSGKSVITDCFKRDYSGAGRRAPRGCFTGMNSPPGAGGSGAAGAAVGTAARPAALLGQVGPPLGEAGTGACRPPAPCQATAAPERGGDGGTQPPRPTPGPPRPPPGCTLLSPWRPPRGHGPHVVRPPVPLRGRSPLSSPWTSQLPPSPPNPEGPVWGGQPRSGAREEGRGGDGGESYK